MFFFLDTLNSWRSTMALTQHFSSHDDDDQHRLYDLNVYWWYARIFFSIYNSWTSSICIKVYSKLKFSCSMLDYIFNRFNLIKRNISIYSDLNRVYKQKKTTRAGDRTAYFLKTKQKRSDNHIVSSCFFPTNRHL